MKISCVERTFSWSPLDRSRKTALRRVHEVVWHNFTPSPLRQAKTVGKNVTCLFFNQIYLAACSMYVARSLRFSCIQTISLFLVNWYNLYYDLLRHSITFWPFYERTLHCHLKDSKSFSAWMHHTNLSVHSITDLRVKRVHQFAPVCYIVMLCEWKTAVFAWFSVFQVQFEVFIDG